MESEKVPFRFKLSNKTLAVIDWANVYGWFSNPTSKSYLGWEIDTKKLFSYLSSYPEIFDIRLYHGTENGNARSEDFGVEMKNIGYKFITKEVKWAPVYLNEENHFKTIVQELFNVLDSVKITNSEIATKLYELGNEIKVKISAKEFDSAYSLIENLDTELKKLNVSIDSLQKNLLKPCRRRKCDFDVELARDVFNMSSEFDTLILFSGDGDYAALVDDLIKKGKKIIVVFGKGHKGKEYIGKQGLFLCSVEFLRPDISL